jgi:O-antigen/teichoic acid export membrane protein
LIGVQEIRPAMLAGGAVSLLQSGCMVVGLLWTKDPTLLVVINVISNLALNVIAYAWIERSLGHETRPIDQAAFVTFGLHQSALRFFDVVAAQTDKVLAFHMVGDVSLAMYVYATALPEQIRSLFKNFSSLITTRFVQRDLAHLKRNMMRYLLIMMACTGAVSAVYIAAAPLIYRLLFHKYVEAIAYSQVFALSIITMSSILPQTALQMKGLHREQYLHKTSSNIIQTILNVLGALTGGLWGLIYAQVAGRWLSFLIVTVLFYLAKEPVKSQPETASEILEEAVESV